MVTGFFPEVLNATVRVLEKVGCAVSVPAQTCCGQAAHNAGLEGDARRLARKTLRDLGDGDDPVVVPSGSCADMLIHHLPRLLADDPGRADAARRLAGRVVELTSFLVDRLGVTDLGAVCQRSVAYHPSCHGLRNLGLGPQARLLLGQVAGLRLVEFPKSEECCGFGGLFSVELPEVSTAIMNSKLDHIESAAPDLLVGGDVSCLLHLGGGLRRRGSRIEVRHIAEILSLGAGPITDRRP
jgi:L-lactate dehydrogenase complex protein LldE